MDWYLFNDQAQPLIYQQETQIVLPSECSAAKREALVQLDSDSDVSTGPSRSDSEGGRKDYSECQDLPEDARLQAAFFPLISAQQVRPEGSRLRALVGRNCVMAVGPWRKGHHIVVVIARPKKLAEKSCSSLMRSALRVVEDIQLGLDREVWKCEQETALRQM